MTTTYNEGNHPGEFIVSEALGRLSRETGTVKSGENLVDGQLVELNGTKLVAKSATLDTDGSFSTAIEGIVIGDHDASATGTNADIPGVVYIKRLAEVDGNKLTYPTGSEQKTEAILELAQGGNDVAHDIRVR